MPVKFNVVERGNPAKAEAPKKFYPSIQSGGRMTLRELAKEISTISTVSSTDTMAVLEALLTIIPKELSTGQFRQFLAEERGRRGRLRRGCARQPDYQSPAAFHPRQGIQEGAGHHRV